MIVEIEIKDVTGETISTTDDFTEESYDNILDLARSLQNLDYLVVNDCYFNPSNVVYMSVKKKS
jgi:hypothetical protein